MSTKTAADPLPPRLDCRDEEISRHERGEAIGRAEKQCYDKHRAEREKDARRGDT